MSRAAEAAARRARLWPAGGIKSSELDVVSPVELRRRIGDRRREAQLADLRKRVAEVIEAAAEASEMHHLKPFAERGARQQCADIMRACCTHFRLRRVEFTSHRRTHPIVYPRQIAMYLAAEFTPNSLPEIGRRMGGFDHTTVLHAWQRMKARLVDEEKVQADIGAIQRALGIEEAQA